MRSQGEFQRSIASCVVRHGYAASFAIAVFLFVPSLWVRDFWMFNEGRRALVALDMHQSGRFLVPHLMGAPLLSKPPLFYWAEAMAFHLLGGPSDWAARMPSVLAGIAGVLALARMLAGLFGRGPALLGAAAMATMPIYCWMAPHAEPEMLFAASGVVAMMCFSAFAFEERPSLLWRWGVYAALAVSFLTKGPLVPASILAAILLWRSLARRTTPRPSLLFWPGLAIVLLPFLVWIALLLAHGFSVRVFLDEILSHVDEGAAHSKKFSYYFGRIDSLLFPWSFWLLGILIVSLARVWRSDRRPAAMAVRVRSYWTQGKGERLGFLLWFLASILVISLVTSKRYYYGLILAPPFASLCAMAYRDLAESLRSSRSTFFSSRFFHPTLLAAGVGAAAAGILLPSPEEWEAYCGKSSLDSKVLVLFLAVLFCGMGISGLVRRARANAAGFLRSVTLWTALGSIALVTVFNFVLYPRMNEQYSMRRATNEIREHIGPQTPLYSLGSNHAVWFYLGRPAPPSFHDAADAVAYSAGHPGAMGLVDGDKSKILDEIAVHTKVYVSEFVPSRKDRAILFRVEPSSSR